MVISDPARPLDRESADSLLTFIQAAPTPFHAVARATGRLGEAGFREVREADAWDVEPGGRYYLIRNDSSLVAFIAGTAPIGQAGFRIIGAHTDSPNLRVKPQPVIETHGYLQLGVEVYGGALLASWTDRDLGLAGRVMLSGPEGPETRLLLVDRPIGRIPQLAIHLNRDVNTSGLTLNRETHLPPIIGLDGGPDLGGDEDGGERFHRWLADELGLERSRILAHELMFFDLQPPVISGIGGEFIQAARLDNLAGCHAALEALVGSAATEAKATRLCVLYDNEEVGSATRQGAAGSLLEDCLERIGVALGASLEEGHRARATSMLISADMAHAVHPSYADRHEARHLPKLNAGPVIKLNANARYATDAVGSAHFQALCEEAEVPFQKFVMRADLPCGSTIGPIVSTRLGIQTVDVGNPMLSMHSCREMAGVGDHGPMIRVMGRFFLD